jgi:excisionase family DNA binding protein
MLTTQEVSERLNISLALVYREIRAGRLRAHCFGRRTYRITEADLQEYLDDTRLGTADAAKISNDLAAGGVKPARGQFRHIKVNRLLS